MRNFRELVVMPSMWGLAVSLVAFAGSISFLVSGLSGPASPLPVEAPGKKTAIKEYTLYPAPPVAHSSYEARPLFSRGRQPASATSSVSLEESTGEEVPLAILKGVIVQGERRLAVLSMPNGEEMQLLEEGSSLEGWAIARIRADSVVLQRQDKEHYIRLVQESPSNVSGETMRAGTPANGVVIGPEHAVTRRE